MPFTLGRVFTTSFATLCHPAHASSWPLEKDNAVKAWRDLMGPTNPAEAAEGTIRKDFAASIGENAVHGSDSDENAGIEIGYFFSKIELV